jgi:8-oxo-dGTP diphosphatase
MKTLPKRMSSAAIMVENSAGELLIVKANYKEYWTLPGGIIDEGETPKQAACREVNEEVGIDIKPEQVTFVAVVDRISNEAQTYQFLFKAELPSDTKIILQSSELDEYAFVARDKVLTKDRYCAKAVYAWANNLSGYIEETFEEGE